MPAASDITAKDLAAEAGTDPKTFRKFLRSHFDATERSDEKPGQGGRYSFTRKEANKILKAFKDSAAAAGEKKAAAKAKASEEAVELDEVEDIEDLDLEDMDGPSDEELEELEVEDD